MALDLNNPQPLYLQIVNDIKASITSGKLQVGDRLASLNELSVKYNVSLITVKKALADLNREGLIYSRVGKGTYIANRANHVDFTKLKTIGFVLRDLESPFFSKILASVEKRVSEVKFNLLLSSTAGRADREESLIQHFLEIGVSGLIIASMSREYKASTIIKKLHEENFPYVVVSYIADEDISYVGTDHEEGAFAATQHLIRLGYKKIGYMNGIHDEGNSLLGDLRKKGYLNALKEYEIESNADFEYRFRLGGEWTDYQSGYDTGLQFVRSSNKPEAIFVFDDLAALGFQKAVLEKGLRVPEDIAIVGFDNIRRGVTAPVPLTTINQPTDEIGQFAVDVILKKINGQPVQTQRLLKPTLIVRESCGAKLRRFDMR